MSRDTTPKLEPGRAFYNHKKQEAKYSCHIKYSSVKSRRSLSVWKKKKKQTQTGMRGYDVFHVKPYVTGHY